MNYDIVAGLDNTTLNSLISQIYSGLYPKLFKQTITINDLGFASVEIDFQKAPTADLSGEQGILEHYNSILNGEQNEFTAKLPNHIKYKIMAAASASSFVLNASQLNITLNYTDTSKPSLTVMSSLSTIVQVQSSSTDMTFQIESGTLTIPSDPGLALLLNGAVVPLFLIPYLNNNLLSPIQIPNLKWQSIQVSTPTIAVQSPYVTAFSAMGTTQPDIPSPFAWPNDCIFIGVDTTALMDAAAIPFPLGPNSGFDWGGHSAPAVWGSVGAQLAAPSSIVINQDGSLTITINASAWAQLTVDLPIIPNFTIGPNGTATLTATATPSVNNGELTITINSVDIPSFSWSGLGPLDFMLDAVLDALGTTLTGIIDAVLVPLSINVYQIPTISFTLGGLPFNINLNQATTSAGGPQSSLLMINAQASVN